MPARDPQTARVPGFIHFTANDYRMLARACLVAAAEEEKEAAKQENPSVAALFNASAKRYRELAEKNELAARVL